MKLFLSLSLLWLSLSAAPIDRTIDEMMGNSTLKPLHVPSYDPFKRAKPLLIKKQQKEAPIIIVPQPLHLIAVLNDRVNIDGKWYKKDDNTREGKIIKIENGSVWLQSHSTIRRLKLSQKKTPIVIKDSNE